MQNGVKCKSKMEKINKNGANKLTECEQRKFQAAVKALLIINALLEQCYVF